MGSRGSFSLTLRIIIVRLVDAVFQVIERQELGIGAQFSRRLPEARSAVDECNDHSFGYLPFYTNVDAALVLDRNG